MRRKAFFFFVFILLFLWSSIHGFSLFTLPFQTNMSNESIFIPESISLIDDAYHPPHRSPTTEWWYFDATLDHNYTLQYSIHVYDFYDFQFSVINLNIYQAGKQLICHQKLYHTDDLEFSHTHPFITKDDAVLMKGYYDGNKTCVFTIQYTTDNASINLTYHGLTQGWKGTTSAGQWTVTLPQATVEGILCIENNTYTVHGEGYHDHNWNVTINAGLNFGWIWGKTQTKHYAIIWSTIMNTWFHAKPLLVVNTIGNGYENIPNDFLEIRTTSVTIKNGFIIPTQFIINAQTKNISINAEIKVNSSDYTTVLGMINYWRYHVRTTGIITVDEQTEEIDDENIAEFIRFRFY